MIRLFRRFDLYFYPFSFISFLVFTLFLFDKSKLTLTVFVKGTVFYFFESFFHTLKLKSSNIISVYFFVAMSFMLIFLNVSSIFCYNFAFTSQVRTVLFLSMLFWTIFISFNMIYNLKGLLEHIIPQGSPFYLTPFLFLIEIIRNLIRPITLIVRLVANILSGHLLIILLSRIVFNYFSFTPLYILLNTVEIFVALIQSYIFITITCLYYSEIN